MSSSPDQPTVAIRKCASGDEAALSLIGRASFLEAFAGTLAGRDLLEHCAVQHAPEKYQAWLADERTTIWIAEASSAPVGYLVLTTPDLPLADLGPGDLEVKRVYLLHRFQGSGLGRRLMNEALAHARASGARRILLGVYGKNDDAIAFYERIGYSKIGTRMFRVGSTLHDDLILGRPVD